MFDCTKTLVRGVLSVVAGVVMTLPGVGRAADITKADTTTMNQAADWGGTAPSTNYVGVFDSTISDVNAASLSFGGTVWMQGLRFANDLNGPVTFASGGGLYLTISGLDMSAANEDVSFVSAPALGSSQTWNVGAGRTLTVNAALNGNHTFTKQGAGTLILSANGSRASTTVLSAGTMRLEAGNALSGGAQPFRLNGGTLQPASDGNVSINGTQITQGGAATVSFDRLTSGTATQTAFLNNLSLTSGTLTVTSGPLWTGGTATIDFNQTTLATNATVNVVNSSATTVFHVNTINGNPSGVGYKLTLTGDGNFDQDGVWSGADSSLVLDTGYSGTCTLDQANTFTGGVTINTTSGGTLYMNHATGLGPADSATVTFGPGSDGILELSENATIVGLNTDSGTPGTPQINPNPLKILTVNNAVANTYAGTIGAIQLKKDGAGVLNLTGANTFTSALQIDGGALQALDGTGLPAGCNLLLSGGVFQSSGSFTRGLGGGAGTFKWDTNQNGGFAAAGGALTVNIGGAGASLTWADNNFVDNNYEIVFGSTSADNVVTFENDLNLGGFERTIRVTDNSGSANDWAVISGDISNGSILKVGDGTLKLTGSNTYSGDTTVSNGTLSIGSAFLDDDSSVFVGTGCVLDLDFVGSDDIAILTLGGVAVGGTVNAASHPTYITGSGSLVLPEPPPPQSVLLSVDLDSLSTGEIDNGGATLAQLDAATKGGAWNLNTSMAAFYVQSDGGGTTNKALDLDMVASPSGTYAARIDMNKGVDLDVDLADGSLLNIDFTTASHNGTGFTRWLYYRFYGDGTLILEIRVGDENIYVDTPNEGLIDVTGDNVNGGVQPWDSTVSAAVWPVSVEIDKDGNVEIDFNGVPAVTTIPTTSTFDRLEFDLHTGANNGCYLTDIEIRGPFVPGSIFMIY